MTNFGTEVQNSIPFEEFCAQLSLQIPMVVDQPQHVKARETQELIKALGGKR